MDRFGKDRRTSRLQLGLFAASEGGKFAPESDVGGGPLYDMGVYCINAARYLFRAEPEEVMAWHSGGDSARVAEVPATKRQLCDSQGTE